MLSTLAICVVGLSAMTFRNRREKMWRGVVHGVRFDGAALRRDLRFFLLAYGLAVAAAVVGSGVIKLAVGLTLIPLYLVYAYVVVSEDGGGIEGDGLEDLYFDVLPLLGTGHPYLISLQVLASLGGIVIGAHVFVDAISNLATSIGVDALLVSLLVAPVATELPEKVNSVLWMAKGKDHLAVGNVTGAMVFQSTFPVSIGLFFTAWSLGPHGAASALIALSAAAAIYLYSKRWRHPAPWRR